MNNANKMNYTIFDQVKQGVIIQDFKTADILHLNQAMQDILGCTNDKKFNAIDIIKHEDTKGKLRHDLEKALDADEAILLTTTFKTFKNTFVDVVLECRWFNDDHSIIYSKVDSFLEVGTDEDGNRQEFEAILKDGNIVIEIDIAIMFKYKHEDNSQLRPLRDYIYDEDLDWVITEVYKSIHDGLDIDISFRLKNAEFRDVKWIRLRGHTKMREDSRDHCILGSINNIQAINEITDPLHLERVMTRKITNLTDASIFRLYLKEDIIQFLGSKVLNYFAASILRNFSTVFADKSLIYRQDMHAFYELLDNFEDGVVQPVEFRIISKDGRPEWFRIIYDYIRDAKGNPYIVVGKAVNIEQQKMVTEEPSIDVLTKCYNKIATHMEVDNLNLVTMDGEKHAFYMIDIDNFKVINGNLGNHLGDIILADLAKRLKECFGKDDIVGRIGGDEFIAVLKNYEKYNNDNIVLEKAEQICKALKKSYAGKNTHFTVSASIGIVDFPQEGKDLDYLKLCDYSDKALFASKSKGKNCYTLYTEDLTQINTIPSEHKENIRSNSQSIDTEVVSTVFNLLYESRNIEITLNVISEYLCTYYDADRIYIYEMKDENSEGYELVSEWKVEKYIDEEVLDYVPEDVIESIFEEADEDGVFYNNNINGLKSKELIDILISQDIKSLMLFESLNINNRRVFLGLDDCKIRRGWTEKEVTTLFHASRMIFEFLNSKTKIARLEEELKQAKNK
ncbi:MAG: diguanylate cyclase [bacterium]